jgi:hypothetical protein
MAVVSSCRERYRGPGERSPVEKPAHIEETVAVLIRRPAISREVDGRWTNEKHFRLTP